jgi:hypothetical protein
MRRLILLAAVALGLGLVATPAIAGNSGTGCITDGGADIVGASVSYNEGIVGGGPRTLGPSCKDVTFTMTVVAYDSSGVSTGVIGEPRTKGSGDATGPGPYLAGVLSISGVTAPYVCVYFTSSKGMNVYDVAPDDKCPSLFTPGPTTQPGNVFAPGEGAPGGGFPYT